MKRNVLAGIFLIILGIAVLVYYGITYTTRAKVLQLGPFEAAKKTDTAIPLPPILGGAAIAAGCVWILIGAEKL